MPYLTVSYLLAPNNLIAFTWSIICSKEQKRKTRYIYDSATKHKMKTNKIPRSKRRASDQTLSITPTTVEKAIKLAFQD